MSLYELLLLTNLLLLIGLGLWQWRIRRALRRMEDDVGQGMALAHLPDELVQEIKNAQPVVSIHILNPMQLAVDKHWLAGVAGRITPRTLRKIVASEAVRMIRLELPKYGVEANVEILRGK